jgi:hypothetical protein
MSADRLPRLKDGDKLDGSPCSVPASLGFCHTCDCLRTDRGGWSKIVVDGFVAFDCPRHDEAK